MDGVGVDLGCGWPLDVAGVGVDLGSGWGRDRPWMWLLYEWTLDRVGGSGDVATVRMDLGSGRGEWGCGHCTNGPWIG